MKRQVVDYQNIMLKNTWFVIPMRGGSREIPRKNVRFLGDQPLMFYTIKTLLKITSPQRIIILTDDEEISYLAEQYGLTIIKEPRSAGKFTLDRICLRALKYIRTTTGFSDKEIICTIQSTSPFLTTHSIKKAIAMLRKSGSGSIISVRPFRALMWSQSKNRDHVGSLIYYKKRDIRQELEPMYKETGSIAATYVRDYQKNRTRLNKPIKIIKLNQAEGLDIDDFKDWSVAEFHLKRKKIIIWTDASSLMGMGHVYRCLSIAQELAMHDIIFYTTKNRILGSRFLKRYPFKVSSCLNESDFKDKCKKIKPDLTIIDRLNTTSKLVNGIRSEIGCKILLFEDDGTGAPRADLLVSDLYRNKKCPPSRQLYGIENAILAPHFETGRYGKRLKQRVQDVLVFFGGSDPSLLTEKTLKALSNSGFKGNVTVIKGLGIRGRKFDLKKYGLNGRVLEDVRFVPKIIQSADLAFSSAGRTLTELMTCGIPVICICQNSKELTHTHARRAFGVVNIGLGSKVSVTELSKQFEKLSGNYRMRKKLQANALQKIKHRSNRKILERIFRKLNIEFL